MKCNWEVLWAISIPGLGSHVGQTWAIWHCWTRVRKKPPGLFPSSRSFPLWSHMAIKWKIKRESFHLSNNTVRQALYSIDFHRFESALSWSCKSFISLNYPLVMLWGKSLNSCKDCASRKAAFKWGGKGLVSTDLEARRFWFFLPLVMWPWAKFGSHCRLR